MLLFGLGVALLIGAALLALSLVLARPSSAPLAPAADLAQTSEGGEVTVKATWLAGQTAPTFSVALNTHSIALDGYDLRELAILRVGGREVVPVSWEAPTGGHHRFGTLIFPAAGPDGTSLITPDTRQVELVIRDLAGVPERVLTWNF